MCEDTVMKLFNQLLVAPAALGLLAPLSAIASEVNISEISSYSDIEQTVEEEVFDHNTFAVPLATNSSTELNLLTQSMKLVDSQIQQLQHKLLSFYYLQQKELQV